MAASFIKSGVLKSGSPRLKLITSTPLFFNSLALAAIARVAEEGKFSILSESLFIMVKFVN